MPDPEPSHAEPGSNHAQPRESTRYASDGLLRAAQEIRDLENEKRKFGISTPSFRRLAEEIEAKSRAIFRRAADESEGDAPNPYQRGSIDDVDSKKAD